MLGQPASDPSRGGPKKRGRLGQDKRNGNLNLPNWGGPYPFQTEPTVVEKGLVWDSLLTFVFSAIEPLAGKKISRKLHLTLGPKCVKKYSLLV